MLVVSALKSLTNLFPSHLRTEVENDIPALSLAAGRLAMEVLDAELNGLKYLDAVEHPNYPLMARVHHGVLDTLQWRMPPQMLGTIRTVCKSAARGDFDPFRKAFFNLATRKNDPEAALARFFLFQGIRLNLYVWTWNQPEVEASGCLAEIENEAQQCLEKWLNEPEMQEPDLRPLNIVVADAIAQLGVRTSRMANLLRRHVGDVVEQIIDMAEATRLVRAMDAADAAVFRPGRSKEPLGSQRIADRFPWHFPSANAVEQRRSRIKRKIKTDQLTSEGSSRLIDVILDETKEGSGQ